MGHRLGVDVGGTFTDFALFDDASGAVVGHKSPTDRDDPAHGVRVGLEELADVAGIDVGSIEYFVHGTTIGLNSLLQRRGARLGLVTTKGFRDVLEIARVRPSEPMDFAGGRPAPLVPRDRVFEVDQRMLADGSVRDELDDDGVRAIAAAAVAAGCEGLVICLINSYRNPAHEYRVRDLIAAEHGDDLFLVCSCDVWRQSREYERATVALLNAFVQPEIRSYVDRLGSTLREAGLRVAPLLTRSNGGVMSLDEARERPVETLLSGPASGVVGAIQAAAGSGIGDLLTFDMGGTSADISIVRDSTPTYSRDEHIGPFPLILPVVGVSSIGAGGGSIVFFDHADLLRVGPQSAGSDPGPACYGRGGTRPTLTDAYLLVGYLNPANFLGGRMPLDVRCAMEAFAPIAQRLGVSVVDAASSACEIAASGMYAELTSVLSKEGIDPTGLTLVAFGGAGPLQAATLAEDFHIGRILVPLMPGTLCAMGAISSDVRRDRVVTVNARVAPSSLGEFGDALRTLEKEAEADAEQRALGRGVDATVQLSVEARYTKQAFALPVPVERAWFADAAGLERIAAAFHAEHARIYGHCDEAMGVDVLALHAVAVRPTPKPAPPLLPVATAPPEPFGRRPITYRGQARVADLYQRGALGHGHLVTGPAIVEQADTTTVIPPGWRGEVDAVGNLILERLP